MQEGSEMAGGREGRVQSLDDFLNALVGRKVQVFLVGTDRKALLGILVALDSEALFLDMDGDLVAVMHRAIGYIKGVKT
jgi:hypothetical protein